MSEYPHSTDWSAITVAGGNRDSMFVIHWIICILTNIFVNDQ